MPYFGEDLGHGAFGDLGRYAGLKTGHETRGGNYAGSVRSVAALSESPGSGPILSWQEFKSREPNSNWSDYMEYRFSVNQPPSLIEFREMLPGIQIDPDFQRWMREVGTTDIIRLHTALVRGYKLTEFKKPVKVPVGPSAQELKIREGLMLSPERQEAIKTFNEVKPPRKPEDLNPDTKALLMRALPRELVVDAEHEVARRNAQALKYKRPVRFNSLSELLFMSYVNHIRESTLGQSVMLKPNAFSQSVWKSALTRYRDRKTGHPIMDFVSELERRASKIVLAPKPVSVALPPPRPVKIKGRDATRVDVVSVVQGAVQAGSITQPVANVILMTFDKDPNAGAALINKDVSATTPAELKDNAEAQGISVPVSPTEEKIAENVPGPVTVEDTKKAIAQAETVNEASKIAERESGSVARAITLIGGRTFLRLPKGELQEVAPSPEATPPTNATGQVSFGDWLGADVATEFEAPIKPVTIPDFLTPAGWSPVNVTNVNTPSDQRRETIAGETPALNTKVIDMQSVTGELRYVWWLKDIYGPRGVKEEIETHVKALPKEVKKDVTVKTAALVPTSLLKNPWALIGLGGLGLIYWFARGKKEIDLTNNPFKKRTGVFPSQPIKGLTWPQLLSKNPLEVAPNQTVIRPHMRRTHFRGSVSEGVRRVPKVKGHKRYYYADRPLAARERIPKRIKKWHPIWHQFWKRRKKRRTLGLAETRSRWWKRSRGMRARRTD